MNSKEFTARVRTMNRELRVMERRRNELIKMDRYGGLGKTERDELEKLFEDIMAQASDNVDDLLKMIHTK